MDSVMLGWARARVMAQNTKFEVSILDDEG